jgi:hypothetical protein
MLVSQLQSLRSMATTAVLFLLGVKEAAPLKKVSSRASHGQGLCHQPDDLYHLGKNLTSWSEIVQ